MFSDIIIEHEDKPYNHRNILIFTELCAYFIFNDFFLINMKKSGPKPLHSVSIPGYSFVCWLKTNRVTFATMQEQISV